MRKLSILLLLAVLIQSCKKTDTEIPKETQEVNNWVLSVLEEVYLWEKYLPTNVKPSSEPDTKDYFDKLLYQDDYWSYITDDYDGLLNALDGVYKDFGFSFTLMYMYPASQNSDNVVGVVEYVLTDSPAGNAGIRRGDIFNKVGGVQITVDNYRDLLDTDLYLLGFVRPDGNGDFDELPEEEEIASVVLKEDPIFDYSIIQVGVNKVGYLMYNAFIYSASDSANLVDVFHYFKSEGVSELVLDLRYNGGGATYMATMLASMVVGESNMKNNDLFYSYIYNEEINNYFQQVEGSDSPNLKVHFMDMPVNLNLKDLYVLTLGGTASASELIINGLNPYMDVIQIGDVTYGKYTVSIPIQKTEAPGENWGMLPIIAKSVNINGVTDYYEGLTPYFTVADDYFHPLGDPDEALLNTALYYIGGTIYPEPKSASLQKIEKLGRFGGNSVLSDGVMTTTLTK